MFSLSVEQCSVATQWKSADIIPLLKSATVSIENLRPISLLSNIGKLLEKRVLQSIKDVLISSYGLNQFGFRPNSSTLYAMISLTGFISSQLDFATNAGAAVISFDLSRAFDRLPHDKLFESLLHADLPHNFLSWLIHYFQERKQRVVLRNETCSSYHEITSGVPQGSILSPCLFACYMGSLSACNKETKMVKYADDVAIAIPYVDLQRAETKIKEEMKNMHLWCQSKGLQLNEKKTKIMLINEKCCSETALSNIETVDSMKILGITLQKDLKWNSHISNICKAAARRVFLLKELKRLLSVTKQDLIQVYFLCTVLTAYFVRQ